MDINEENMIFLLWGCICTYFYETVTKRKDNNEHAPQMWAYIVQSKEESTVKN